MPFLSDPLLLISELLEFPVTQPDGWISGVISSTHAWLSRLGMLVLCTILAGASAVGTSLLLSDWVGSRVAVLGVPVV